MSISVTAFLLAICHRLSSPQLSLYLVFWLILEVVVCVTGTRSQVFVFNLVQCIIDGCMFSLRLSLNYRGGVAAIYILDAYKARPIHINLFLFPFTFYYYFDMFVLLYTILFLSYAWCQSACPTFE